MSLVNAKENEEFPDLAYNYMSVSSIGDIADREIIGEENLKKNLLQLTKFFCLDVIGIFYKKKKKVIPLQSYTKEEHSIKILDDKGKKVRSMKDNFKILNNNFILISDGSRVLNN